MKIILSPAKALNTENTPKPENYTNPHFLEEAIKLNAILKKKSVKSLGKLMNISENLATLNWERNQNFSTPFTPQNATLAAYTFNGQVYEGLNISTLAKEKIPVLENKLLILSGLYGILKPFDLMQPYRLEMGTSMKVGKAKNLYEFWKDKITNYLNDQLTENENLVNLASKEYFSAINFNKLRAKVITPQFKDFKNGQLKSIFLFIKKARGYMSRFIIEEDIKSLDELKTFNVEGYSFSPQETKNENEPVFIR